MKPAKNPQGPERGKDRVLRGGGWGNNARFCRAAYRFLLRPGKNCPNLGFRIAFKPPRSEP